MISKSIRLLILACLTIGCLANTFDEKQFGYYAFDKAGPNDLPPRVRPPPYIQSNIPCSGVINDRYLDNKDTLCGDLKRGFIPLNPMNVIIQGQHYPFELIKNKTLYFLAKSLPYLKEDHDNIPKVFKIGSTGNDAYSNIDATNGQSMNRVKRQAKATITKLEKSELALNSSESNLAKNEQQNQMNQNAKNYRQVDDSFSQESKSKECDPSDGILCHMMQVLASKASSKSSQSSSLFTSLLNAYQTIKAAKNVGNFLSSLDKSDNTNEKSSENYSLLNNIFNMMGNSQTTPTTLPPQTSGGPFNAMFDYFSNSNNGLSLIGNRKKNPSEYDEFVNGLAAASSIQSPTVAKTEEPVQQVAQLTPTACPSIEEYVTPVYARNYQGIWKYIVQVPHEGYFTQTIQKTSCVKSKCDYMDGACKESNRWVSLLVAEVYYPNAKQPLSSMIPQSSQLKPTVYNALNTVQNSLNGLNGLNGKLNGQSLAGYSNDANAVNYELFNSLLPNYNDYNHYDQTFARRASYKSSQPTAPAVTSAPSVNPKSAFNYQSATYSLPQYQDFNLNSLNNLKNQYQAHQPNYNQLSQLASQFVNSVSSQQPYNSAKLNQAFNTSPQTRAQFQQLVDLYNQQIVKQSTQYNNQQLPKSKSGINAGYSLIDSLTSEASMMYPTVVSQSSGAQAGFNQPMIQPIQPQNLQQLQQQAKQQNEIKPRSFDGLNSQNILDSTLMKSSYINNNEETAASNSEKVVLNDQSQPTDLNNNNNMNSNNNQAQPNQNDQNENSSREAANGGEECDGYDSNGCFMVRVYYDWFLVGGSCKCWKANAKQGSFEALKKMFIGK